MEFNVFELDRNTENTSITFSINTDGGKNCNIANDACYAQFLVHGIKNQIGELAKVCVSPGFKPFVQLFVGIRYLSG